MPRRDYEFGQQLGRGAFGIVHRVKRLKDGRTFVCKEIELSRMNDKLRQEAHLEVELLKKVSRSSTYIVMYEESFLEGDLLHIIMEFCERGDLSQYLKGCTGAFLSESIIWKFLIQIGLGIRWLHANRVLHRDIKSLNVFLTSQNDVRLGDLGVARVLSHNTQFANTFVGTPYYLSPELCEEKPYNEKSDVWAYGCVVYEMCTLKHPFDAKNQGALLIKILRGRYAPIRGAYSKDLRSLVDWCMERDFQRRPKLAELLEWKPVRFWAEQNGIALDGAGAPSGPSSDRPLAPRPRAAAAGAPPAIPRQSRPPPAPAAPVAAAAPPPPPARRRPSDVGKPSRVRVRPGGGNMGAAKTKVLYAPPSANASPQVIRAPRRPSNVGVIRGPPGRAGDGSPPSRGSASEGVARQRGGYAAARNVAEERRRAEREVALLPDRVIVKPQPKRNVPTVQQMKEMEDAPPTVPQQWSYEGGSSSGSDAGSEGRQKMDVLAQAAELTLVPGQEFDEEIVEETMLPPGCGPARVRQDDGTRPPRMPRHPRHGSDGCAAELEVASGSGEEAVSPTAGAAEEVEEEDGLGDGMELQGRTRTLSGTNKELSMRSAFEDSLAFTDGTALSFSMTATMRASGSLRASATQPMNATRQENGRAHLSAAGGLPGSPGAADGVDAGGDGLSFHLTAQLDADGLLCDANWRAPSRQQLAAIGVTERDVAVAAAAKAAAVQDAVEEDLEEEAVHDEAETDTADEASVGGDTESRTESRTESCATVDAMEVVVPTFAVSDERRPEAEVVVPTFAVSDERRPEAEAVASATGAAGAAEHEDSHTLDATTVPPLPPDAADVVASAAPTLPLAKMSEATVKPKASVPEAVVSPVANPAERRARLERRIKGLNRQITRLHADVVKDLDDQARGVWGELYALFQAKVASDLTDEDQVEIERYIFEHLPPENAGLLMNVYKVLHLEQERERCERRLQESH